MKKIITLVLALAMAVSLFTGCGKKNNAETGESDSNKLSVVTTIFPEYDWVREILGGKAESTDLTMLLDNGVDLHSYQPTAEDMLKISDCDILVFIGGESDAWVQDVLKNSANDNRKIVNLLEILGDAAKQEETVEGMQAEQTEEPEADEHIWLSLKNAQIFCQSIAAVLQQADSEHADGYQEHADAYVQKLTELDQRYEKVCKEAPCKTLLFADRFPFRYLVDDYGLQYYAAFSGCSAETEASFETVSFLAGKVDALGLKSVITLEGSDQKIASTILQNTKDKNQMILSLDSMQSITGSDAQNGVTYLSVMEKNLEVLKQALA